MNGEGEARLETDADGQVADTITKLQAFETTMISRIGTAKATIV